MSAVSAESPEAESSPPDARSVWFVFGAIGQLLAWGVLLALLILLVPRQQQLLADFDAPVPRTVEGIFAASEVLVRFWFVALPLLAILVLSAVYLVVELCRRPVMRMALLVILAVVPLGWAIWCHLSLMAVTSKLIQDLS
jgi:type II secretory pathway component PulF